MNILKKFISRGRNCATQLCRKIRRAKLVARGLADADKIFTETTAQERDCLYSLAQKYKGGVAVEIGSAYGASSCFIAAGIGKTGKVYCIDKWNIEYRKVGDEVLCFRYEKNNELIQYKWNPVTKQIDYFPMGYYEGECPTYVSFKESTRNFRPPIAMVRQDSAEASKMVLEEIDLLFIDGWHEYEMVKLDVLAYLPKVRSGGVVALHDCGWAEGVKRIIEERVMPQAESFSALPNLFCARLK